MQVCQEPKAILSIVTDLYIDVRRRSPHMQLRPQLLHAEHQLLPRQRRHNRWTIFGKHFCHVFPSAFFVSSLLMIALFTSATYQFAAPCRLVRVLPASAKYQLLPRWILQLSFRICTFAHRCACTYITPT